MSLSCYQRIRRWRGSSAFPTAPGSFSGAGSRRCSPRSPSSRLTFPRTCSRSSTTTSSTLAAATAIRTRATPIQYDEIRIEHDPGDVEIVVYNRAIPLFMTDSEAVRRIHQVCCRLDELATAAALIGSRRVDAGA